jgi:vancomycin permeability regulator SanA
MLKGLLWPGLVGLLLLGHLIVLPWAWIQVSTAPVRYPARRVPAAPVALVLGAGLHAGFDTWDSCVRARRLFGVRRAIVVTQLFHLPRAVALCRAAGIETAGVGHDSASTAEATTDAGYLREVGASAKALSDLVRKPPPRFLGPPEPGLRRALGE